MQQLQLAAWSSYRYHTFTLLKPGAALGSQSTLESASSYSAEAMYAPKHPMGSQSSLFQYDLYRAELAQPD